MIFREELMKEANLSEVEKIFKDIAGRRGRTYDDRYAMILQPDGHNDFHAHPDFDEAFTLWTQDDAYRGLDIARLWSLVLNLKHVLSRRPGAVAELGVYKGHGSAVLAHYAHRFDRLMYMADTFTGFAETQYEASMGDGKAAAFKDTSLDLAKSTIGEHPDNRWIVGMFPDSITPEMRAERFAFVSIDCDLYDPIAAGLRFFWPRMTPGGMIFIHDYSSGHWPGATKAVDEFCAATGILGSLLPDMGGSYVLTRPLV